ncbi:MAG TPA: ankyrin repeat domain-containing protein [Ornithinibacter sp.]|nr:ankyrin repeat domain-containing protein [Ornithinibacter sp.]
MTGGDDDHPGAASEAAPDPVPEPAFEAAVRAVRSGDLAALALLLSGDPELASARTPAHGGRTLLHVATDWPGHHPNVTQTIAALVASGADVDAPFAGEHPETPLHWAASSDDTEAVAALLDAGADIDAPGAVIGGGTPLSDATAFGQWRAAALLVDRGATVSAWDAAALGLTGRVVALLAARPHDAVGPDLDGLLWAACHGGHLDTATHLLGAGADVNWLGWDGLTPLDAAERAHATDLAAWLRDRGALSRDQLD